MKYEYVCDNCKTVVLDPPMAFNLNCVCGGLYEQGMELSKRVIKSAPKHDDNNYEKVDYSLVPWELLTRNYIKDSNQELWYLQFELHRYLNGKSCFDVAGILEIGAKFLDVKLLACALGYGASKYYRDSWREGFGGNPRRILKAAMRHCHKALLGEVFDGEDIEGYPQGNVHLGAVYWCLMVAEREDRD